MREKEFLPLVRERLGIAEPNGMQRNMLEAATRPGSVTLLSPTGSGKTLAFLMYVLKLLRQPEGRVQAVVIAPSRELVTQIYNVVRQITPGYKTVAVYGGHSAEDEARSLGAGCDIITATPGRLLDHVRRGNVNLLDVRILVLDEFDKSLELGFGKEMTALVKGMKNMSWMVLTSATDMEELPEFVRRTPMQRLSFLENTANPRSRMRVHRVESDGRDKLDTLRRLLLSVIPTGQERTIVFVNHRESAERVAAGLRTLGAEAGLYHGALDQHEREKALSLFNNGTRPLLVATDLAARGLDIEKVKNIIHYHQPLTAEAYTHRNGRSARMQEQGDIFVITGPDEDVKEFIEFDDTFWPDSTEGRIPPSPVATLYISAGRKEKLSRGDIAGFLIKQGGLEPAEAGKIDLRDHYTLAAVPASKARELVSVLAPLKIKGTKRKISVVK